VAALPGGEPGVPQPGDGAGAPASRRRRLIARPQRALAWLALGAAAWTALGLATDNRVVGVGGLKDALHVALVCAVLFAIVGFGPTRLLLPERLRRHELIWVAPVGAAALALELTLLGYAFVPFDVALAIVLLGSVALGAYAWWRAPGLPAPASTQAAATWRMLLVPLVLCLLIGAVALIPMFRAGFATVVGNGSDAHLAVGSAKFLQDHPPTSVAPAEPVDQIPQTWRSKPPIYFAFAAVARLAGMEPYAVISTLAASLLAMTALGWWLVARDLLGAGLWAAGAALGALGLNRIALHTGMHPYFNQTWGYLALPFALVLSHRVVHDRTRGGMLLFAGFLALLAFAYPLALPIPLIAAATFTAFDRRRHGLPIVRRPRRPSRRRLRWMVPLGLLLVIPLLGILEKVLSSLDVLAHGKSLANWGGDLTGYFDEGWFFGVDEPATAIVAMPLLAIGAVLALRRAPRDLRWGLGAVIAFGVGAAIYFRTRNFGWYFHYKTLAFVAPIAVVLGVVGLSHLRRTWVSALALTFVVLVARNAAGHEIAITFDQLPRTLLELKQIDHRLPDGSSLRLDMNPDGRMLWAGYLLSGERLCSQRPVLNTDYPHVPISRAADYVLVDRDLRRPYDAVGGVVVQVESYAVYRLRRGLPGGDRCSQRMVQTVTGEQFGRH
jgi:hypothetical protein